VASHRTKRAVRGALSFAAVITVASIHPIPALAQPPAPPPPNNASEALKQFQELSDQAEQASEDLNAAKADLANKQAELTKASADLTAAQEAEKQAKAQEEQFRGQIDTLASASFQGARFNNLSALLTGGSQEDFLERASALSVLAADNRDALKKFTDAVDGAKAAQDKANDAVNRSKEATAAAEQLANQITQSKDDLEKRAADAKKAYERLSGKEKTDLENPNPGGGVFLAPAGAAQAAVQTALDQVGDRYVYGAAGPNQFDCSGLVMFAFKAVGLNLPHSSRMQYNLGKPVAHGQWVSGDLLFYGTSAARIHHVAIYIGGGNIVHASTTGQPVKVVPVSGGGRDYFGAKRIVG
jgi:peptidoglycan DL-endopeptidase CwlO